MKIKKMLFGCLGVVAAYMLFSSPMSAHNEQPPALVTMNQEEALKTFVVTSTFDSGNNTNAAVGTLRRSFVDANNNPGLDRIIFDLPGSGVKTIKLTRYLTELTDDAGVIIDGTQSDDRIEIDGSALCGFHGLYLMSDNNIVRGLTINGVNCNGGGAGIYIGGGNRNVIVGNLLGTNATGNAVKANRAGILLNNSHNNIIGGTQGVSPGGACTGDCNLLSGNGLHGIVLDNHSSNNRIIGNYIGTNKSGNAALPNHEDGILIANSHQNTVGGSSPAERNLISGNRVAGIEIGLGGSYNNVVRGNWFGTQAAGNGIVRFDGVGILVDLNAHDNLIDGNVIVGHESGGILVFRDATRTEIKNNRVGISPFDDSNLGNDFRGIEIQANNNHIHHNRVANNASDGIRIKSGMNNRVSQNEVFNNGTFGINLGTDAFTPNDGGDGDSGPNGMQNFPTINLAAKAGSVLTIQGILNSRPNARYTLEFFQNPACDLTFNNPVGEGRVYIGTSEMTTDGGGNGGFVAQFNTGINSGVVTATATDSQNNTSELSYCRAITSTAPQAPSKPVLIAPKNNLPAPQNPPFLDWSASSNAQVYKVVVRVGAKKGPKVVSARTSNHQFTPEDALQGGQIYYWRVKACNSLGDCVKSAISSFHIP